MKCYGRVCAFLFLGIVLAANAALAQVPTPFSVLGHTPGDDFYLANYEEAVNYFHILAAHTDRMKMFTVGKTTQGRDIEVGVISAPENLARLDEYKGNTRRLPARCNSPMIRPTRSPATARSSFILTGVCIPPRSPAGNTPSRLPTSS